MDDFTRQACIAALRFPDVRRRTLASYITSPVIARPHELDLDIDLLLKATFYASRRIRRDARIAACVALFPLLFAGFSGVASLVGALIVFIIASAVLSGRWLLERENTLVPFFWPERFDRANIPPKLNARTTPYHCAGPEHENQDLTIHAPSRQFVGFGTEIADWKFVVDTKKGTSVGQPVRALTVSEMYTALSAATTNSFGSSARVSFQYFMDGTELPREAAIAPSTLGKAPCRLPEEIADRWRNNPEQSYGRHYLVCTLHLHDQIVITSAARLLLHNNLLSFEQHRLVLYPFSQQWYQTERCVRSLANNYTEHVVGLLIRAPFDYLAALLTPDPTGISEINQRSYQWAYGDMQNPPREESEIAESRILQFFHLDGWNAGGRMMCQRRPNFGCSHSIREALSDQEPCSYRNREQILLYSRMLDRVLFDAFRCVLEKKGISTEDFDEVRQTIVNSGVFIGEGNLNASSVAVGASATASTVATAKPAGQRAKRTRHTR